MKQVTIERMKPADRLTNPVDGTVKWDAAKSIWYSSHLIIGAAGTLFLFEWSNLFLCGALTVATLCCGHTVGLHRMLIHRSLVCPRWLERTLVYLGTLVGMGGPFGMIRLHEIRDWAQRHDRCHPFFIHRAAIWKDWIYNLHCKIELEHPPIFTIEKSNADDPFYRFLQRTWMAQQLPVGVILFLIGGWGAVAAGVPARIALSLTGHWLIGYFAHNCGLRTWHLNGHSVQGFNIPYLGVLTMGECWHNNHHAYPNSARLGHAGQSDPGWWFVAALRRVGLAQEVMVPDDFPDRPERVELRTSQRSAGKPGNKIREIPGQTV